MLGTMIIPLLVSVAGVLLYALASNAKLCEIGRLAYFAGLLVCLFVASHHVVKL